MVNLVNSKRFMLVCIVILLWVGMGALSMYEKTNLNDMSVFFLSLTGFVASYIWGESVRPASSTSLFVGGQSSTRELLIYVCVLIWTVAGAVGIIEKANLQELATYYSSLTPFVSSYIIGVSYKPGLLKSDKPASAV